VIEKDMPGFTFGKKEKKLGIRASATRELVFKNCFVPEEKPHRKTRPGLHPGHEAVR
jgi:alkylation response protein AidB-like acyl-CoA dehydrogenase